MGTRVKNPAKEDLDDDLMWLDGRRKRKQMHNQGGHTNVWQEKKIVGRRVRV